MGKHIYGRHDSNSSSTHDEHIKNKLTQFRNQHIEYGQVANSI